MDNLRGNFFIRGNLAGSVFALKQGVREVYELVGYVWKQIL
jgi:N-acetylglucosamine-6-phosphate deacetylase